MSMVARGRKLGQRWAPKPFRESWKRKFVERCRGWAGSTFNMDQACRICGKTGRNLTPVYRVGGPGVPSVGDIPFSRWLRLGQISVSHIKDVLRGCWECRNCRKGRGPGRKTVAAVVAANAVAQRELGDFLELGGVGLGGSV